MVALNQIIFPTPETYEEKLKNLIAAQKNYIEFLEKHIRQAATFQAIHGWVCNPKDVLEGDELRKKIKYEMQNVGM